VLLDANLRELGTWTAPSNVTVQALALDAGGNAVLAGSVQLGAESSAWLKIVELPALREVWPSVNVGPGHASAVSLAGNGDILVAGRGRTEQTLWLQRFDSSGAPRWAHRSELTTNGYFLITETTTVGNFQITGVAEQSNGAILVSTTSTFRYEPGTPFTFPPGGQPPATCSDSGGCDCGPRGWQIGN
jgi:hypothetical protein